MLADQLKDALREKIQCLAGELFLLQNQIKKLEEQGMYAGSYYMHRRYELEQELQNCFNLLNGKPQ